MLIKNRSSRCHGLAWAQWTLMAELPDDGGPRPDLHSDGDETETGDDAITVRIEEDAGVQTEEELPRPCNPNHGGQWSLRLRSPHHKCH